MSTYQTVEGQQENEGLTYQAQPGNTDEQTSMIMFIVGFFVPIVWIVGYCMYRTSHNPNAARWAKFSFIAACIVFALYCVGVALSIGISIIYAIIVAIVVGGNRP